MQRLHAALHDRLLAAGYTFGAAARYCTRQRRHAECEQRRSVRLCGRPAHAKRSRAERTLRRGLRSAYAAAAAAVCAQRNKCHGLSMTPRREGGSAAYGRWLGMGVASDGTSEAAALRASGGLSRHTRRIEQAHPSSLGLGARTQHHARPAQREAQADALLPPLHRCRLGRGCAQRQPSCPQPAPALGLLRDDATARIHTALAANTRRPINQSINRPARPQRSSTCHGVHSVTSCSARSAA